MDSDMEGEVLMKLPSGEVYAVFYYENDVLVSYAYEGSDGKFTAPIVIKKDDEIRCYFKNGAASLVAIRKNGEWHGDYIVYNPKGEIIEKKKYVDGQVDGESVFNFSPKLPYSSISYALGLRHGQMKLYHLNGKLMLESSYVYGKKHGEEKEFDKNGKAVFSRMYYNGEMIAESKL
jgi:antitoxin component YwqK of YwqJK toxin-antitoxin module